MVYESGIQTTLVYHFLLSLHPIKRAIGQGRSISKIASTSAKSTLDLLRRAFNWLSKLAASGNTATVGAEF
ncbi:hypothetical protein QUB05_31705 [Microcoleus sp. F10-C6]|uniref:hypothetical protein n=1 Tax=unclassified Microcoleus TaxID=2642155 RepID=UPI002FD5F7BE